jgi:hypothetical protein
MKVDPRDDTVVAHLKQAQRRIADIIAMYPGTFAGMLGEIGNGHIARALELIDEKAIKALEGK